MASTSLLMAGERDPKRRDEMENILDAATRASELTRRLLALGKRQPLQIAATNITSLIDSVVTMIRRVIPADIEIDVLNGHSLPMVLVDAGQVEQVLMNLCLNARDAMQGGGRLTIETEHVVINGDFTREHPWARPGRYVLLAVTDTGAGKSAEVLERVFEPFFTTKSAKGGTGLGLAVSRGIIEQHGGLLHAYSEPNIGTTFKVLFSVGRHWRDRIFPSTGSRLRLERADLRPFASWGPRGRARDHRK
jgi:signal transduction histidine kinase